MAGILDSKKRVMDTIITQEGKRQLAAGQFQIKYASFTDTYDYYEGDNIDGCTDATQRIHLEASHAPNDSIVIESDDSGKLISFNSGAIVLDNDGSVIVHGPEVDDVLDPSIETGDSVLADVEFNEDGNPIFSSLSSALIDTTFGSFDSHNIIRTEVYNETINNLSIERVSGPEKLTYTTSHETKSLVKDEIPTFINDSAFFNINNFKYLPPINRDGTEIGSYNNSITIDFEDVKSNIQAGVDAGDQIIIEDPIDVLLKDKNDYDNIMIQVFEIQELTKKIIKLDLLDLGVFSDKRYFLAGKVRKNSSGEPYFLKIFILRFSNDN